MNELTFGVTAIVLTVAVIIAYAKGVRSGRHDEREELQRKHKFVASRQLHKANMAGPFWRN